ncbi:MAG TPA: 2OG-Fe(II) oxygenase [Gammaproteobacteria bacterium]|nr:2OG-Fe(II) oxygenase [Gammaproteobacteria bacterium]
MISEQRVDQIADALATDGYIIIDHILPDHLLSALQAQALSPTASQYKTAGVGREQNLQQVAAIRKDEISWIDDTNAAGKDYLAWMEYLRCELNRRLFIGIFDYECHYAHYAPGDYYKTHLDAFKGNTNRIVTTVLYLNADWTSDNGGELVMYAPESNNVLQKILPEFGRLVIFLSDKFPHEVLPANKHRYSIAGWFRVNNSSSTRVDPA